MDFGKTIRAALIGILGTATLSTAALAETQLKALTAWPATLTQVKEIFYKFEENVTKATGGEITFQNLGPETAPAFEQFEPVSAGVFDLDYGSVAYHQAQTGVALGMALLGGMDKVRSSGVFDWLNDYYGKKFGIEILAIIKSPNTQFVLLEPLKDGASLEGRRIRSNALYEAAVRQMGAVPVAMSPADAYAAMQKGTLDGVAWPMHATADFKLYEVAKYMTMPGFGQAGDLIIVNKAKMESLSAEVQKAIREEGLKIESYGDKLYQDLAESQSKTMEEKGVKISELTPEAYQALTKAYGDGVIEVARKSAPDDVDAFIAFARSKGALAY